MIRFIFTRSIFLLSLIASTSWATTLTVADNLIVSQINNKPVDHGFIGNKSDFSLKSGKYALVLHYKDVFEDLNFAEQRVVQSKEFVVKFTVEHENKLNLMTKIINNLTQAEAFAKAPTLSLKDEKNQELFLELSNVDEYKIAEKVELAITTYATQQASKHTQNSQPSATDTTKPILESSILKKTPSNKLIQIKALPMLKYWWQNASSKEKTQFKQYMSSKNHS